MSDGDNDDGDLVLADGTRINTRTGLRQLPGLVEVPTATEAVQEVTRVRRKLADLPDVPEKMNIVAVVCSYYMFGLDDWEIAHAIGCTEQQVINIKMLAAFTDMVEAMQTNIMDGQAEDVRSLIAAKARTAALTMANELTSANGQNRIVAAKDILDRAGHRPADVIEHKHRVEGGLKIEYVQKGGKDDDLPTIDITPESLQ